MGEAADDLIDWLIRRDADSVCEYDYGYDFSDEDSGFWSEWRKDNMLLARHIKSGGVSHEALKLGMMLRKVVDPWDGWEPL